MTVLLKKCTEQGAESNTGKKEEVLSISDRK
mgnify:FL=1